MNWLDVSTYIIYNGVFSLLVFVSLSLISFLIALMPADELPFDNEESKKTFTISLIISALFSLLAMVPTHNKVLEVKIAKIKNEAVNKENITKGIDTLERIGKKLECKYLGCEDEK